MNARARAGCDVLLPKFVVCCGATQPFHLNVKLPGDGKAKSPEDTTLLTLKVNDVFRISTKADASYGMPKNTLKT